MQQALKQHPYIQAIRALHLQHHDRRIFHQLAAPLLVEMGNDSDFLSLVAETNLNDTVFIHQKWSLYNIPCLYIYEDEDMYLKIHFFPTLKDFREGSAAHCIHHHNNYILTTAAIFGSGYESMLFEKEIQINPESLHAKLKIAKRFTQKEFPVHTIDAWEPHIVYQPESFSATLQLWTPDKIRTTDKFRHWSLIKAFKTPLRQIINWLKLENVFGISSANTYQFYPAGNHFIAIDENVYFEPTRKASGVEVEYYSMQTICYFLQKKELLSTAYLRELINRNSLPKHYLPLFEALLNNQDIEQTFAKTSINIPQGNYTLADVIKAAQ